MTLVLNGLYNDCLNTLIEFQKARVIFILKRSYCGLSNSTSSYGERWETKLISNEQNAGTEEIRPFRRCHGCGHSLRFTQFCGLLSHQPICSRRNRKLQWNDKHVLWKQKCHISKTINVEKTKSKLIKDLVRCSSLSFYRGKKKKEALIFRTKASLEWTKLK